MRIPPSVVADIEWAVVALTGLIAIVSLLGALYSIPWTFRSRQQVATRAFNYLWITRALLQVIAACYALSLDLRLQVLWGAKSVIIPGGYYVDAMCRLYIGLSFGLLEPSFLLLVLFACMYTVYKHTSEPGSNPNLFIFALTVGLTLPMCAAQVFAALFSRIMTQLRYNEELMHQFFAASAPVTDTMCPDQPENPNCAVCLFPEFSTLISAAFALMYLFVLWMVLGRIANAAINKMLARRIRLLQICITLFFCASITLRGVTVVNVDPYSLDFVALWLANVVVGSGLILVVSAILVWVPVYDGRLANERLGPLSVASASLFNAPTELLPLVGYGRAAYSHDAASSDYGDYAGSQAGDHLITNPLAESPDSTAAGALMLGSSSGLSNLGVSKGNDKGHRGSALGASTEASMMHRPMAAGVYGKGSNAAAAGSSLSAAAAAAAAAAAMRASAGSSTGPDVMFVPTSGSSSNRAQQRRRTSYRSATPDDFDADGFM